MTNFSERSIPLLSAAEQQVKARPIRGTSFFRVIYGQFELRGQGDAAEIGERVLGHVSKRNHFNETELPFPFVEIEECSNEIGATGDIMLWSRLAPRTDETEDHLSNRSPQDTNQLKLLIPYSPTSSGLRFAEWLPNPDALADA